MIKVSVIVPMFNAEKFLRRCIQSLQYQTLTDIEIICVDDCSTDHSKEIVEEYKRNDTRIKLYNNRINQGAAICRNLALDLAKGEYIQFVDADDYLDKSALENLYYIAEKNKLDMCFLKMKAHYENAEMELTDLPGIRHSYKDVFSGKELLELFIRNKDFFYYAWMVFYKREFLEENHLKYKNMIIGEGGDLILRALVLAKKTFVSDNKCYNYSIHPSSITNSPGKNKLTLFGQIVQYISLLQYMAEDTNSKEIFGFLEFQVKKISGGISNLSNEEITDFKKKLENRFSKHVFQRLLFGDINSDFTLQADELKKIRNSKYVILFGAGYALKGVLTLLNQYEIEILGIAVSHKKDNPKCLYGHHIYEISELIKYNKDSIVIVTANCKYEKEIQNVLNLNGFYNILFLNVLK